MSIVGFGTHRVAIVALNQHTTSLWLRFIESPLSIAQEVSTTFKRK